MKLTTRALHFVFKIGDRAANIAFYRDILGMKVLRHEEFSEGCDAKCNGEYNNRWSKTMVGYGPEDDHFVVELTYNYPVKNYLRGNDFLGLTLHAPEVLKKADCNGKATTEGKVLTSPDGYPFVVCDQTTAESEDPVRKVTLASSNLSETIAYWNGVLGFEISSQTDKSVTFKSGPKQAELEFQDIGTKVEHAEAYGRIAFSVPEDELLALHSEMESNGHKILTKLVRLDTPGKASVVVTILADPDGHEICFVNDEGFRALSQVDHDAEALLQNGIKNDKSGNV